MWRMDEKKKIVVRRNFKDKLKVISRENVSGILENILESEKCKNIILRRFSRIKVEKNDLVLCLSDN